MDISALFGNAFHSPKIVELSSDVIVPLAFPGGCAVSAVEGRYLCSDSSWRDVRADLFISAEEGISSLISVSANIRELITIQLILSHANGKCRRVSIYNALGRKMEPSPEVFHTFVPVSIVLGLLLLNLHKFEVSKKLRFASLGIQCLEITLDTYPKVCREKCTSRDSMSQSQRFSETAFNSDEFEEAQNLKYKQNYRTMRYIIPPSIARTDLRKMLQDGVPQKIADRVWSKKALWLLCMHPTDIPKVHIADLRGKYDCHGLDIVELGALWHILPRWEGGSPKAEWRRSFKNRLDELVHKESCGKISPNELRDPAYKGFENLIIYDPDRPLYRQFGVSATAKGLQPGQRRVKVFTAVDLRDSEHALASFVPVDRGSPTTNTSSSYHSPDTDSEREGQGQGEGAASVRLSNRQGSIWGRSGGHGREKREHKSSNSSDADLATQSHSGGKRKSHRRKKRSSKAVEGRKSGTLSPLSGQLAEDRDADINLSESKEEEEECTDKDTELDDLLNYEINLSCLDLDLDLDLELVDCPSDSDSSNSSSDDGDNSSWREVTEEIDPLDLDLDLGVSARNSRDASPHCIPQPRKRRDLPPSFGLRDVDSPMRIENIRPFSAQIMRTLLKKPMKRLNFIAAPAKTPESRQWLQGMDSSGLISFDAFPDIVYDIGKKRVTRKSSKKFIPTPPLSTSRKVLQRGSSADTLKPWGSTGARRRTSTPNLQPRPETSSPLENIYNEAAGDRERERFEFNPLVFSSYPDGVTDVRKVRAVKQGGVKFRDDAVLKSVEHLDLATPPSFKTIASPYNAHVSFTALFCENPLAPSATLSSESQDSTRQRGAPSGMEGKASLDFLSPTQTGASEWRIRRLKAAGRSRSAGDIDTSERDDGGEEENVEGARRRESVDSSYRGFSMRSVESEKKQCASDEPSAASIFSSFSAFSLHSVQSAVKYLFSPSSKDSESVSRSGKYGSSSAAEGQLQRGRGSVEEQQRNLERELHNCGDGSPNFIDIFTQSAAALFGKGMDSEQQGMGTEACTEELSHGQHTPALRVIIDAEDGQAAKRFFNTFTTVSPRMARKISEEEELADVKIEAEIDNFIVPDELSPIILRQYGIEMGIQEVNGIRQNALMSLPALLSEIGRVSIGLSDGEGGDEGDEIEEMSDSELGLWGEGEEDDEEDRVDPPPPAQAECLVPGPVGTDLESSDAIERLINGGGGAVDGAQHSPMIRGILKNSSCNSLSSPRGDTVCWGGAESRSCEDTDSEGIISSDRKVDRHATSETPQASLSESVPGPPLTPLQAEDLILHKEARLAWAALEAGTLCVDKDLATSLLLKLAEDPEGVTEPLETLVLLVDKLGADVNAMDRHSMTPLHSLFSTPALGRFILSRGGDLLLKDDHGDCALSLCAEYGYSWLLPAFISMHSREAKLLEDKEKAHEYAVMLLTLWGFGNRVRDLVEEGVVSFSCDEALELLDLCSSNFEGMKEPVETFELLESLVLKY